MTMQNRKDRNVAELQHGNVMRVTGYGGGIAGYLRAGSQDTPFSA